MSYRTESFCDMCSRDVKAVVLRTIKIDKDYPRALDLCEKHNEDFNKTTLKFLEISTYARSSRNGEATAARAWAKENGYTVGKQGLLRKEILADYRKAMSTI